VENAAAVTASHSDIMPEDVGVRLPTLYGPSWLTQYSIRSLVTRSLHFVVPLDNKTPVFIGPCSQTFLPSRFAVAFMQVRFVCRFGDVPLRFFWRRLCGVLLVIWFIFCSRALFSLLVCIILFVLRTVCCCGDEPGFIMPVVPDSYRSQYRCYQRCRRSRAPDIEHVLLRWLTYYHCGPSQR